MSFQIALYSCVAITVLSVNLNCYLYFKLKQNVKTPQKTIDAQQLLHEITGGQAILRINVIDPGDILLKSPRS